MKAQNALFATNLTTQSHPPLVAECFALLPNPSVESLVADDVAGGRLMNAEVSLSRLLSFTLYPIILFFLPLIFPVTSLLQLT